jgi:hypothetical protein
MPLRSGPGMTDLLALCGALTMAAYCGVVAPQTPFLTPEWVHELEASLDLQVVLSDTERLNGGDPMPVAAYARHYRMIERDGRLLVEAVFAPAIGPLPSNWQVRRITGRVGEDGQLILEDGGLVAERPEDILGGQARGIHINERFPSINDGGCSVVTLSIDYATSQVLTARCNGVA